jgi:hypothetical protein
MDKFQRGDILIGKYANARCKFEIFNLDERNYYVRRDNQYHTFEKILAEHLYKKVKTNNHPNTKIFL